MNTLTHSVPDLDEEMKCYSLASSAQPCGELLRTQEEHVAPLTKVPQGCWRNRWWLNPNSFPAEIVGGYQYDDDTVVVDESWPSREIAEEVANRMLREVRAAGWKAKDVYFVGAEFFPVDGEQP